MEDRPRRYKDLIAPGLVFLAGSALFLAYFIQYVLNSPFARVPMVDGQYYWLMAYDAVMLKKGLPPVFFGAPAYPFLLMGLMALAGPRLALVYIVQALLFMGTALLCFDTARRLFSRTAALAAAVLVLLYGPLAFYSLKVLPDCLGVFLLALYVNLWLRRGFSRTVAGQSLIGIIAATGILCRGQITPVIVLTFLWGFSHYSTRETKPRKLVPVIFFLIFFTLTLLPWALYMKHNTGRLTIFLPNTGLTLWEGNNPAAQGTYARVLGRADNISDRVPDMIASASEALGRKVDVWEADRYFRGRALSFITKHPGRFALLLLQKLRLILWPREVHDIFSLPAEARTYTPLLLFFFAGFGLLLPLSCAGAYDWLRNPEADRREMVFLLLAAAGVCATLVVFFVNARYRLLLLPALAPLAGNGFAALIRWFKAGKIFPFLFTLIGVLILLGIQAAPGGPGAGPDYRASEAKALAQSGNQDKALQILSDLVRENPDHADTVNSLTVLCLWQGDLAGASQYARKLASMPGFEEEGDHFLWLIGRIREVFLLEEGARKILPTEAYHAFLDESAEAYFQKKRNAKRINPNESAQE
ncbi:MAG: glycosyltransferase family 39 protein [Thermodesulfobacteriota bacterium]